MTLDEARDNIGNAVVYRQVNRNPYEPAPEQGVITSVNGMYVFVRYGESVGSQPTHPGDLTLMYRGDRS